MYTLISLSFVLLLYSRIFIFTLRLVINFFPEFSKTLLNESIECDHDRSCHVTRLLQFLDYRKIDRSLLVLLFVNKIHCIQCNSLRIINWKFQFEIFIFISSFNSVTVQIIWICDFPIMPLFYKWTYMYTVYKNVPNLANNSSTNDEIATNWDQSAGE